MQRDRLAGDVLEHEVGSRFRHGYLVDTVGCIGGAAALPAQTTAGTRLTPETNVHATTAFRCIRPNPVHVHDFPLVPMNRPRKTHCLADCTRPAVDRRHPFSTKTGDLPEFSRFLSWLFGPASPTACRTRSKTSRPFFRALVAPSAEDVIHLRFIREQFGASLARFGKVGQGCLVERLFRLAVPHSPRTVPCGQLFLLLGRRKELIEREDRRRSPGPSALRPAWSRSEST